MNGNRMMGIPRTESERATRHQTLYGDTNLPPRGTGLLAGNTNVMVAPNKVAMIGGFTGMMTGIGGYALSQVAKGETVSWPALFIIGIGSGCIGGLTSFLVTRYIGE